VGTTDDGAIFLLIAAEPNPRANSTPPVEVFRSEGVAREAFVRRRLEAGSGSAWAELVAVEGQAIRLLCWFGCSPGALFVPRRPHTRGRWAVATLALSMAAFGRVSAGISDRATVDPASHSFPAQGIDAARTSVVLPAHAGPSR
jgi:hypothetical protein